MSKESPLSFESQTGAGESRPLLGRLKANFESFLKKGAIGLLVVGAGLGILSASLYPLAPVPFVELANVASRIALIGVAVGATYLYSKNL